MSSARRMLRPSAAGILAVVCLPLAAGLLTEPGVRQLGKASPRMFADVRQLERASPRLITEAAGGGRLNLTVGGGLNLTGSLDCLENNGGTCRIQNCFDWRGPQTCHLTRCFCSDGTCAGTDGRCHSQRNKRIGSTYRLENVRFPGYYL
mmetsp:Transcript_33320/g.103874  ORF Transcript_33320/g.103874 Transcript_33320/m.103874 type:complete len:149 (+) Transcript_33320:40-486(+)